MTRVCAPTAGPALPPRRAACRPPRRDVNVVDSRATAGLPPPPSGAPNAACWWWCPRFSPRPPPLPALSYPLETFLPPLPPPPPTPPPLPSPHSRVVPGPAGVMNTRSRTRSGGAPPPAPIAIKKKTSTNAGARSKAKAAAVDKAAAPAASAAATAASASASAADKAKTVAVAEDAVAASKVATPPATDAAAKKAEAAAAKKAEAAAKKADAASAKKAEAAAKKAESAAAKKAEKKAPASSVAAGGENGAGASAGAAKQSGLSVGDDFPAMKLLADDGKEVDLGAVLKEQGLVLFMYPKANTPGCTKQACGFRENTAELSSAGFAVYGMSADTPAAQTSWKTKHNLAYPLLCDRDLALVKAIGAFKAPKNIKRSHIVVAKGGKVLDVRVMIGPEDSFKEAVKFVKGLDKAE